jgi:hypothetical protein
MASYQSALPAQSAAGADSTTLIDAVAGIEDLNGQVVGIVLTPPNGFSTVTGVVTNNATITVRQLRAGVFVQNLGAVTLGSGTNLVAETPLTVPVTSSGPILPNDVLDVLMHQNGTGIAIGAGVKAEVQLV